MLQFLSEFFREGAILSIGENRVLLAWGKKQRHKTWPREKKVVFHTTNFFLNNVEPYLTFENSQEFSMSELQFFFQTNNFLKKQILWKSNSFEQFGNIFHDLQKQFAKGVLQKAVPYSCEIAQQKMDSALLQHCLQSSVSYAMRYPVYLYGFWDECEGVLGATPELLFRKKDQNCFTMACAGTSHSSEELLESAKDCEEHEYVVKSITESLKPLGMVEKEKMKTVSVGSLFHLVTPIKAMLSSQISIEKLILALHPTPALGTYPREKVWEWLKTIPNSYERKYYGAPFTCAWENGSHAISCVAIRNIQWSADQISIFAGCGVIQSSVLEKEWEEIKSKIRSIKSIVGLA